MKEHIHCIGVGGIGLSALAQYHVVRGARVTGSDVHNSHVTEMLRGKGVEVIIGQKKENIQDGITTVYFSPAIPETNEELLEVRKRGIPAYSYPEGLGHISRTIETVSVSGTHGKTSTTAMIAHILRSANKKPTVIVGSLLGKDGTNYIAGDGKLFVVEACEFKESFHELSAHVAVITNIDNDHLDYYGSMENVVKSFSVFVSKIPSSGFVVCDTTLPYMKEVLAHTQATIVDVSQDSIDFVLPIPGEHMKKNARLAAQVALLYGVPESDSKKYLETFPGVWRRSEYIGTTKHGALVFDDYGHHPTEIKTTLEGFRSRYTDKKIVVLFQPHLYSRTKLLFNDFVTSFGASDTVLVAPIYAAREKNDESITSTILVHALAEQGVQARVYENERDFAELATQGVDTIIITLGAGAMNEVAEALVKTE